MRKMAVVAGGAALAIGLAGCGGAPTTFDSAQALVQTVSEQTSQARTVEIGMQMSFGGMQLTGHGVARFAGPNTAMRMTTQVMGRSTEMRLVDQTLYIKLPEGTPSSTSSGKPWVKITPDKQGMSGVMLGNLGKRIDPGRMLQRIKQAGTITRSEPTQLDGEPVTHYWIDLDLGKLAGMYPTFMSEQVSQDALQALRDQTLTMQLWVNSEQLPRKVTLDMSEMMDAVFQSLQQQAGQDAPSKAMNRLRQMFSNVSVTVTYSNWGEPVQITAPPAGKVASVPVPGGLVPDGSK